MAAGARKARPSRESEDGIPGLSRGSRAIGASAAAVGHDRDGQPGCMEDEPSQQHELAGHRADRRSREELVERGDRGGMNQQRSEEHTSELQSPDHLVCRLLLEKKKKKL